MLSSMTGELDFIEDCCEGFGGFAKDRPIGSFGRAGVFGFYPNKQITTGEGGMIVTDDDTLAATCRALRNQGREGMNWLAHQRLGYNYRLSELAAALGVAQCQRLDEILADRRRVAHAYMNRLMTWSIEGMQAAEGNALLDTLFRHIEQDRFIYPHKWRVGDLVLWDNRCTLHARTDFSDKERRLLRRHVIAGERAF